MHVEKIQERHVLEIKKINVKNHPNPAAGKMLTLLVFRQENQICVITISTISMCQNCAISFSADPGGDAYLFAHLAHPPPYNYDMQSNPLGELLVDIISDK